jgi:predicted GNAT family acetyltransferase
MHVESTDDYSQFAAAAGEFLERRSVQDCVVYFQCHDPEGNPPGDGPPECLWVVDDAGQVAGAAYSLSPYRLTMTDMSEPAAQALAEHLARSAPWLPGASGPDAAAAAFANRFAELTGQSTHPGRHQWVMSCTTANSIPAKSGGPRLAEPSEVELIAGWFTSTMRDSGLASDVISRHTLHQVGYQVKERRLVVWEDEDGLIGAAGWTRAIGGVVRPVGAFVLPERRAGGYAGVLLSESTRRALAGGADACVCILDLTYAAMQAVVEKVGYRRVEDVTEYRFRTDTGSSGS